MRKMLYIGIVLLLIASVMLTGCGDTVTDDGHETETGQITEPETQVIYVTKYITEYVDKNVYLDEPIGYLKDHLTGEGSLGTDYPLLSGYGPRDDYNGQISAYHRGMDFGMDEGTQLTAPGKCKVSYTGYNDTRGLWLVLYWGNGYYLVLQHLSRLFVQEGDLVQKGQVIALSGDTGASLTPHLHLEVIQDDMGSDSLIDFNDDYRRVNPYYFVFGMQDVEEQQ